MINSRNCCQGYGVSETPQGGLVTLEICPQSSRAIVFQFSAFFP